MEVPRPSESPVVVHAFTSVSMCVTARMRATRTSRTTIARGCQREERGGAKARGNPPENARALLPSAAQPPSVAKAGHPGAHDPASRCRRASMVAVWRYSQEPDRQIVSVRSHRW